MTMQCICISDETIDYLEHNSNECPKLKYVTWNSDAQLLNNEHACQC